MVKHHTKSCGIHWLHSSRICDSGLDKGDTWLALQSKKNHTETRNTNITNRRRKTIDHEHNNIHFFFNKHKYKVFLELVPILHLEKIKHQ